MRYEFFLSKTWSRLYRTVIDFEGRHSFLGDEEAIL